MTDVATREVRAEVVSVASRIALAALCGAAGLIHLVMAPSHFRLSVVEGLLFAGAGWLQLGLAVALAARPSRQLLSAAIGVNLVFIGAWAFSRIWGLPFGSHEWHPEEAGLVDLTTVGFEAALVLVVAVVLARPAVASAWSDSDFVLASIVPVAVVALTTASLASPGALDHATTSHGDHGAGAGAGAELAGGAPVGAGADGHGHEHGPGGEEAAPGVGPADDKGFSMLTNGHAHETGKVELTNVEAAELGSQLALTADLVRRYPTLADARAAGYRQAGPFSPGLGTHMMPPVNQLAPISPDGVIDTPEEVAAAFLIYDGTTPDSPIAGFMFFAYGFQEAPEGFAGANDHWHFHTNTCVVFNSDGTIDSPLGADAEATQEQCDKYGGRLLENTGYMVHVWSVPGYENPNGTFAEVTPAITCPDSTYFRIEPPDGDIGRVPTLCRS